MSLLLPLSLVLALESQIPSVGEVEPPVAGDRAELTADQLQYDSSRQIITAHGHAVLRTDEWVLRADELSYDQQAERATAKGNVLLVSGTQAALADHVVVEVGSLEARIEGGLLMQKKNVSPAVLAAASTPAELESLGETTVALTGERIQRIGPSRFKVDGLAFTPCDCTPTHPTWRVKARSADVEIGERAILSWPVVYVYDVPVLALPWLHLPLSERRTGLLVPRPGFSGYSGFFLDQPIFITLGQSYDVTLTPGYYTGRASQPLGIRGPRLQTEFRYVPSEQTRGRATLDLLYDLKPLRDPLDPSRTLDGPRGLRFGGSLQHTQELGHGFFDRADLSVVSDGYLIKDLVADVLQREEPYLRSTATVFHRADDSYAELSAALRQDVRWGYGLFDGADPRGPNTLHRLPSVRYALPERPLLGPLSGSLQLEYVRLAPLLGLFGDEGSDGVFDASHPDPDGSQGNWRFDPGEREARDRLDLRPRLSASFSFGRFARATPYLAYRQDFYVGELTSRVSQRGYPMAGLLLDTELSRSFGPAGGLRHSISPALELRWVPRTFGSAPPPAYDEVDEAVPPDGLLQAVIDLNQRLLLREGARIHELLRFDLGQDLDLKGTPRLGDTSGRLTLSLGGLGIDVLSRGDLSQRRLTQLSGNLHFDDGRGDGVFLRYDNLVTEGPERLRRGIDSLIGPLAPPGERADLLVAGGHIQLFGVGLRYEAIAQPQRQAAPLVQQSIGLSYGNSCDCWRIDLHATFRPGSTFPDLSGTLTIARFGSFRTGG